VSPLLIFTDLDGTLLDHHTYSWTAARPALSEIRRRRVPLIFCTSKTRAEVLPLRRRLRNTHPFITENGGGIFIPRGYFPGWRETMMALGRPYPEIAAALEAVARLAGVRVRGFHKMGDRGIARATGLPLDQARLARKREFDEPFVVVGGSRSGRRKFSRLARKRGLGLTRGGRFWHLFSGSDKGLAVRRLVALYRRFGRRRFTTLALGDSANDLPMLAAVDQAVLLPRWDQRFGRQVIRRLPGVPRAGAPGPTGWNEAVLTVLRSLGQSML